MNGPLYSLFVNAKRTISLVLLGLSLALAGGCKSGPPEDTTPASTAPQSPTHLSLASANNWTPFASSVNGSVITPLTNGFQLTNRAGNQGTYASVGWIPPAPIDTSLPYKVTIVLKGVGGAKKAALTFILTGQNPNPDNSNVAHDVFSLTGQDQSLTFDLPRTPADSHVALAQLAIHFGYEFGSGETLGNPAGSGLVIEDVHIDQTFGIAGAAVEAPAVQAPAMTPGPSLAPSDGGQIVSPAQPAAVGKGSYITGTQPPGSYIPIMEGSANPSVNPVAYQNFVQSENLTQKANESANSAPSQALSDLKTSGSLTHPVSQ
jgi:hypothetical protein